MVSGAVPNVKTSSVCSRGMLSQFNFKISGENIYFFYPMTSKLKSVYLGQKTIGGVVPQLWSQVSNFPKTKTYKKRFFFVD